MRASADCAFDEAVQTSPGEVGGAGAGGPLSDEDAQADGAGAGLLERLDLAETDEGGELISLVEDNLGVAGPGAECAGEETSEASWWRSVAMVLAGKMRPRWIDDGGGVYPYPIKSLKSNKYEFLPAKS